MSDARGQDRGSAQFGDTSAKKTPEMVTFSGVKRALHSRLGDLDWLRNPIDRRYMAITWLCIIWDSELPDAAKQVLLDWGRKHEQDALDIDPSGVAQEFARAVLGANSSVADSQDATNSKTEGAGQ